VHAIQNNKKVLALLLAANRFSCFKVYGYLADILPSQRGIKQKLKIAQFSETKERNKIQQSISNFKYLTAIPIMLLPVQK